VESAGARETEAETTSAKIMLQEIVFLFNTKKVPFPSTLTGHSLLLGNISSLYLKNRSLTSDEIVRSV
jgi:hypothetical protein